MFRKWTCHQSFPVGPLRFISCSTGLAGEQKAIRFQLILTDDVCSYCVYMSLLLLLWLCLHFSFQPAEDDSSQTTAALHSITVCWTEWRWSCPGCCGCERFRVFVWLREDLLLVLLWCRRHIIHYWDYILWASGCFKGLLISTAWVLCIRGKAQEADRGATIVPILVLECFQWERSHFNIT